jgi:mRNA-degrading endonuclease toxin of MazEF toxin-antitoxin module
VVKRGEIWLVALDPTVGSEIKKSRPCVIISPPELNEHLRLRAAERALQAFLGNVAAPAY